MQITVEEAISVVLEHTSPLPLSHLPLYEALGRVLCKPAYAPIEQPPFDRSPLDGYAVRSADTDGASSSHPVTLKVIDKLYAGQPAQCSIQPGQAVRLMTGAMIPAGADGVIRQEDTDLGEDTVQVFCSAGVKRNYCHRGEEYRVGETLLAAHQKIDAAAIAVAASAGIQTLPVHRQARAAVISTGDEICQPGQPLTPGKIYDSNNVYLTARLRQLGVAVVDTVSVGDEISAITSALARFADCDLVLTTGGVSVGQKDLLEAAVRSFGAGLLFHGIDMKPGMPTLFAKYNRTLILGLSGNPFSAAVPFELLLRPMLSKMTEDPSLNLRQASAKAANDFGKASPTRRFLRAHFDGQLVSIPTGQGNGQMKSMVGCNCLVDIPSGSDVIHRGEQVSILLL